jgi:hypothetical protein
MLHIVTHREAAYALPDLVSWACGAQKTYKDTKKNPHSKEKKFSTWLDFISFFSYLYRAVAGGAILKVLKHKALIIKALR